MVLSTIWTRAATDVSFLHPNILYVKQTDNCRINTASTHLVLIKEAVTSPEALPMVGQRSRATNSAIRFAMAVARSGGHTREKLWSVLCVLQLLLESFVYLLYSSRCFACKWLIKLDVPPPSASCWVQRTLCTCFTSLPLSFVTVGGSKDGTCTLSIRHGSLLAFSSTACTIAVFHTCLAPSSLVPRYGNGSGNEIVTTQVFKSGYVLNGRITG